MVGLVTDFRRLWHDVRNPTSAVIRCCQWRWRPGPPPEKELSDDVSSLARLESRQRSSSLLQCEALGVFVVNDTPRDEIIGNATNHFGPPGPKISAAVVSIDVMSSLVAVSCERPALPRHNSTCSAIDDGLTIVSARENELGVILLKAAPSGRCNVPVRGTA